MAYSLLLHRFGSRVFKIVGVFAVVVVLANGGGCYTDSINMAPTVRIDQSGEVRRGQPATFTATVSDPNGDKVILEWANTVSCPGNDDDPTTWPTGRDVVQTYRVEPPVTTTPFCVWAFATDGRGATAHATRGITPMNHAPVARIDVALVEPVAGASGIDKFPLYAQLRISADSSTDDDFDPLSYQWSLLAPPGSTAKFFDCPDGTDPPPRCLLPDQPGDYEIGLLVDDGMTSTPSPMTTMAKRIVAVANDQLPCLTLTSPLSNATVLVRDPKVEVRFEVGKVTDDGDPFPQSSSGVARFSWFRGRDMEPFDFLGRDFPSYTLPADAFTIGDNVRVRVEIRDRQTERVRAILDACDPEAATCAGSPGCLQRVTWKIEYR